MLTLLEQMKRSQVWQVATDIVNAFSILIRRSETFHIHLGLTTVYIDGLAIGLSYLSHPMLSYSRRRNGLHDVDLNTFISEEMALHLDNGGTRKRTSAQCGDVITDSPTHKRNRMI